MDKSSPLVFIVLGVFQPDARLFERQLSSLRAQTHSAFQVLLVCDGTLSDEARDAIAAVDDDRFIKIEFEDNIGVHANFARGLRVALNRSAHDHDLFAFCDQDDVWHSSKLETQVQFLADHPKVGLCHCDARVVDEEGAQIAPSMFSFEARSKRWGLIDILIMNPVTGMTCVARKTTAEAAAAFPLQETPEILHDHWLALVTAAQSEVGFVDLALVDYVQHAQNQLGAQGSSGALLPFHNLVFGGLAYWARCMRQYRWRALALYELEKLPQTAHTLARADVRTVAGAARLLAHMVLRAFAGEQRQASQAWRLLAGKVLCALSRSRH